MKLILRLLNDRTETLVKPAAQVYSENLLTCPQKFFEGKLSVCNMPENDSAP